MNPDPAAASPSLELADRLRDLVGDALERPTGERLAFLTAACGQDTVLLAEAMSLVQHDENAGVFLGQPAHALMRGEDLGGLEAGSLAPGETLGECRVVSLLGEGGMGEVYLAEDTQLGRRVAVKLLKRRLDDASLARRFRHERKVLAALTHPNIARLYGGGTTEEGRSYLVMEYVEGERLDKFCDARGLNVGERTALFRKVCAAVAYAHQNLVVHRDLKPANIRVTPEGEPKLLDFGIAKLLDPEGTDARPDPTLTLQGAMTPEYASPEQVKGEAITTTSDVYSLGVVLYELLCGQRPFAHLKGRRPDELARAICEEEPPRPSTVAGRTSSLPATKASAAEPNPTTATITRTRPTTLRRQLEGDLDNIVAKALQKDPARRYASVLAFSEDLRRYSEGLPVRARRDTFAYRAGKFVRRNKVGVTAGVLVVVALVFGLAATAWQARVASRERDRAEQERDHARTAQAQAESAQKQSERTTQFFKGLLFDAAPEKMGKDVKMIQVIDAEGASVDQKLADEPTVLAQVHRTLGSVYSRLGMAKSAEAHCRAALALFERLQGSDAEQTVTEELQLGDTLIAQERMAEAEPLLRHTLAWARRQSHPEQLLVTKIFSGMVHCLLASRRVEEAATLLEERRAQVAKEEGEETLDYTFILVGIAELKGAQEDYDTTATLYRRAAEIYEKIAPTNRNVVINRLNLCEALLLQQKFDEAATEWETLNKACARILGPGNAYQGRIDFFALVIRFGRGDFERVVAEGKPFLEPWIATLLETDSTKVSAEYLLGSSLTLTGHAGEGEPWLRLALKQFDPTNPAEFLYEYGNIATALGDCLLVQKRYAEAEPLLLTGLADLEKRLGPQGRFALQSRQRLHDLYLAWNKPTEAVRYQPTATSQSALSP